MNTLSLNSFSSDSLKDINYNLEENKSVSILTDSVSAVNSFYNVLTGKDNYSGNLMLMSMECRDYPEVVRKLCGFVSLNTGLYEDSSVRSNIIVYSMYCGFDEEEIKDRAALLLKKIGLWEQRGKLVRKLDELSKLKLRFILSVIHSPKVIFVLDALNSVDEDELGEIKEYLDYLQNTENISVVNVTTNPNLCLPDDEILIVTGSLLRTYGSLDKIIEDCELNDLAVVGTADNKLDYDGSYTVNEDSSFSIEINSESEISDIIKEIAIRDNRITKAYLKKVSLKDVFEYYCKVVENDI